MKKKRKVKKKSKYVRNRDRVVHLHGYTLELSRNVQLLHTRQDLFHPCRHCGELNCGCPPAIEAEPEVSDAEWNGAIHGIGSLILSCAQNGLPVRSPRFKLAVEQALEAVSNNLGE